MASLSTLVGQGFSDRQVAVVDPTKFNTANYGQTQTVVVPTTAYTGSQYDYDLVDDTTYAYEVTAVNLTATKDSSLGQLTLHFTVNHPGYTQLYSTVYDIAAINGDQILLGLPPGSLTGGGWNHYVVLSNTDISQTDGYTPQPFVFTAKDPNLYSTTATSPGMPCFGAGTRIAVADGQVAVETLEAGDLVRTVDGELRAITWAGHRTVDIARHPSPELVRPVVIRAGAFAPGIPARDLTLSPDHNVFAGGVLIPAKCLVNDRTVVVADAAFVTYHHIELATHDVVLAEGLPAETYLDTGNRSTFAGGPVTDAHPDFATLPDASYFAWESRGYAPLVLVGPALDAVRAAIDSRAELVREAA